MALLEIIVPLRGKKKHQLDELEKNKSFFRKTVPMIPRPVLLLFLLFCFMVLYWALIPVFLEFPNQATVRALTPQVMSWNKWLATNGTAKIMWKMQNRPEILTFNMHMSCLGILLKCRLWFIRSGGSPRFCISNKHSGDANADWSKEYIFE